MRALILPLVLLLLSAASDAHADAFGVDGFIDLRLIKPSEAQTWLHGGLGKLRFDGSGGQDLDAEVPQVVVQGHVQLLAALSGVAMFRYAPDQKTGVDLIEG